MRFNFLFLFLALLLIPLERTGGMVAPFANKAASMRNAIGPMNLNKLRSITSHLPSILEGHKPPKSTKQVQNAASIGESKLYQQKTNSFGKRAYSSIVLNAAIGAASATSAAVLTSQTLRKFENASPKHEVKEINVKIVNSQQIDNMEKVKMVSAEVEKMLTKILEIPVKIGIADDDENVESMESENKTKVYLNSQNFAGHANAVEIGEQMIRAICGGKDCDIDYGLPEYHVNMCSLKPKPGEDELERALRPMALKLAAKLGKGKLWVDNPFPTYRNLFAVAYKIESKDPKEIEKIEENLLEIALKTPIRFVPAKKMPGAKDVLHFTVNAYDGESSASDGLWRGKHNFVSINKNELLENSSSGESVQKLILKALGVESGNGLRIHYNRRNEIFYEKLEMFKLYAQLNAAYGSENHVMQTNGNKVSEDGKYFKEHKDPIFWLQYPNMETGKYEIPVVYDESFVKQAEENRELLEHVFKTFAEKSVIQFKVYAEPPKDRQYVRILNEKIEKWAWSYVGCWDEKTWAWFKQNPDEYKGTTCGFGAKSMESFSLFHELLHICGLDHEHQRADAQSYVEFDREKAAYWNSYDDEQVSVNYSTKFHYLPISEYNPKSIMHYDVRAMTPVCEPFDGIVDCNYPDEPHELDWVNLNHFYGVGKGRTTFKVENGKIVEDLDGISRLKK